tara:strand:- start:120 stop:782 length:663 start_codon:yes stop_codon:yes gene_type:complete
MNIVEILSVIKAIVHTFIRFLPLGLYSFAYLSTAIFKDRRSAILLMGLIINDIIGYLYKRYNKVEPNENCVIFGKQDDTMSRGFLPNPHTLYISFVAAFFYSDMWYKYKFDFIPFIFILFLLILTIWSRIDIGCKEFKDVVLNVVFGALRGIIYYYFVSSYYRDAEKDDLEKNTCDFGYNDYQCNEIKEGTVIVKEPKKKKTKEEEKEEQQDKAYQGWYD